MEKLPMCRICLVKNVRMYVVVNKNLHELYEKLTDIPFVTEDRRPILACFICCAQLKKCNRLLKKCLQAEALFAQILNEDYELKPVINQDHLEFFHGFIKTPIENISTVEVGHTDSVVVKQELQAVCEERDDILVPKEEHPRDDDLETVHQHNYLEIEYMPPHQTELLSEDDVPLMELKTEVEIEQEVHEKKQKTAKTKRASVAKKPKLPTRRTQLEDTITAELKKTDSKIIQNPQHHMSKPVTDTHPRVQNSINNAAVDIDCRSNSYQDFSCKIRHNKGSDSHGESYKCDVCQRSFNRKYNLIKHILIHTGEKPHTCDVCQRSFRVKGELSAHTRTHTGEKPHKCDVCQHSFSKKDNLMSHIRIHTGEKPYTCNVCQRSFRVKGELSAHTRTHTGEKPHKCEICQRSFNKKDNLITHIRLHTGEKPYTCEVCQRSFRLKGDHTVHIRRHTGEKPYTCEICQRSFSVKGELSAHTRTHTGEKPYKCDVCQRGFSKLSCVKKHIQVHSAAKPYTERTSFKCEFCQRSFSVKSILTKHIRTHTGEKPYKCETCLRSFNQIGTLTRHVRTHTGEKPYKCDVCHRAFGHLSSLKTHVGRLHPSE